MRRPPPAAMFLLPILWTLPAGAQPAGTDNPPSSPNAPAPSASVDPAFAAPSAVPADAASTAARAASFPHLKIDSQRRQVRVECEALSVDAPLEFLCVLAGTSEHESALRTKVKPSDLHTAMLIVGLEPGEPVRYSEALNAWLPPVGPPLRLGVEFEQDGKSVSLPASAILKNTTDGAPMPPTTWVFTGSRILDDGRYAADLTGYVVSLVNFDLTVIDIPRIASSDNATLQWKVDDAKMPPAGTRVVLVIEAVGEKDHAGSAGDGSGAEAGETSETLAQLQAPPAPKGSAVSPIDPKTGLAVPDAARLAALEERWNQAVKPSGAALRNAAQTHYEVIAGLRREQQRLIDDADRVERLIGQLEAEYQDLTTPRPEP